jgi:formylglycine-generating enzyme required for sulfatase activity
MPKIFLSYRRDDSAAMAGRIFDRLRAHFGDGAVYMDIDSIPFGVNFRKHIDAAVGQCDVVLAVIGTKWAGETDAHRRLDDPKDFVRIELESALKREIPLIPILIDHAKMPSESDLPASLILLADYNAIDLDHGRDFHHHVDLLIRGIAFHIGSPPSTKPELPPDTTIQTAEPRSSPSPPVQKSTNTLGMTLIRVEAGEFLMGTTKDQLDQLVRVFPDSKRENFDGEQAQHSVKISRPFFLGVHEVTQGQYQTVMYKNPSNFKGSDDLPAERVTWLDAVEFCNKLSEREKRTPFYRINGTEVTMLDGNGYRLPTEAEWEYACRPRSPTLYPFGDDPGKLGEHAWYLGNAVSRTHPVGQKMPNAFGLYDMLGNVWEWCADEYVEKYYASSLPADPAGTARDLDRVVRGGSWLNDSRLCRPARRGRGSPYSRSKLVGFRVAAFHE